MFDTIIFDLGGVLIDWDPRYLYRKIFKTESEIDDFLNNVATMDWNEQQDGGRAISEATDLLISKHPKLEHEIRAYYGRWVEMLGGAKQDVVDILAELKARPQLNLYALTNWSAETFPEAQKRYEFLNWFLGILVSGVEKLKKPDPKIYQLIVDQYHLTASKCLFIDDNLRNVQAAMDCGITSIHFQNATQLRSELKKLEIF